MFRTDGVACHLGLRLFERDVLVYGVRQRLDTFALHLVCYFLRMNRDRSLGRVACERCCHFFLDSQVRYPSYIPPLLLLTTPWTSCKMVLRDMTGYPHMKPYSILALVRQPSIHRWQLSGWVSPLVICNTVACRCMSQEPVPLPPRLPVYEDI